MGCISGGWIQLQESRSPSSDRRTARSRTSDTDIGSGTSRTRPPRQRREREQARGLARELRTGPAGASAGPLRDVLHYVRRLEAAGAAKRGRVDIYDLARACGAPGPRKRPAGLPAGHGAAVRWFTGALSVRYTSAAPP